MSWACGILRAGAPIPHSLEDSIAPRAPFDAWPVEFVFGEGDGLIWFAPPGIICVQIRCERGTLALAKRYAAAVRAVREMHAGDIARGGGLRLFQDFRALRTVDKAARDYLSAAAGRDFVPHEVLWNKVAIAEELVLVRIAVKLHAIAVAQLGLPRFLVLSDIAREATRLGIVAPHIDETITSRRAVFAEANARLCDP
jgi:hypothetical protein